MGRVGEEQAIGVALDAEDLAEHTLPAHSGGRLLFFVERAFDASELVGDVRVGGWETAKLGKVGERLLVLARADEISGRLDGNQGKNEDNDAEHQVDGGRQKPAGGCVSDRFVNLSTIVGEVGDQDSQVDGASESAGAETTNGRRSNLAEVHRADDDSLADTKTSQESAKVH